MFTKIPKKMIKKASAFLWDNRSSILQMGFIATLVVMPHTTFATDTINTNMPFDPGIKTMRDAFTGPIPKAGSVISVAAAAGMWMFGESQITKVAMRVALGSGIMLGAPAAVSALSGTTVSGCLF